MIHTHQVLSTLSAPTLSGRPRELRLRTSARRVARDGKSDDLCEPRSIFARPTGRSMTRALNETTCLRCAVAAAPAASARALGTVVAHIRLWVQDVRLAQERLGGRVKRQVRADPERHEEVSPVEREVRAWVRRVENSEVGCGLCLVTRTSTSPKPGVV